MGETRQRGARTPRETVAGYAVCLLALAQTGMSATIVSGPAAFGSTRDGVGAHVYTLQSDSGVQVDISSYGACITRLLVPDRNGKGEDVVLGCSDAAEYEAHTSYFGGIVGRVANRIRDGRFTLNGECFQLARNNGGNALHGGEQGFNKKHWACKEVPDGVELSLTSPAGDEGYPGDVTVSARYTLKGNTLRLDMKGLATTPTPLNLAQHSYFNLAGHSSGQSVLAHSVTLYSSTYTPLQDHLPTGEVAPVANTPYDFTRGSVVGLRIADLGATLGVSARYDENLSRISIPPAEEAVGENKFLGFDDNFVVDGPAGPDGLAKVAFVAEPSSGRTLLVESDAPGVQFYTGNFLGDTPGKAGASYQRHGGLCLETQHYPDSIGRDAGTPFSKGACRIADEAHPYQHTVQYTFGVEAA